MIQPGSKALSVGGREKLRAGRSQFAGEIRGAVAWMGFFLLCLFVGGEEVQRQRRKLSQHIRPEE
jgi:hypothetical protein